MIRQEKWSIPVRVGKIAIAHNRATAAVYMSGNRRFEMGATEPTVERLLEDLCNLEEIEIGTRTFDPVPLFGSYYRGPHGPAKFFRFDYPGEEHPNGTLRFRLDGE